MIIIDVAAVFTNGIEESNISYELYRLSTICLDKIILKLRIADITISVSIYMKSLCLYFS